MEFLCFLGEKFSLKLKQEVQDFSEDTNIFRTTWKDIVNKFAGYENVYQNNRS